MELVPALSPAPAASIDDQVVQSWDTASKADQTNDYSVCTTWLVRDRICYLLDVYRRRLEYPALKRAVLDLARQFHPTALLIENKGSGQSLIQELRDENPIRPIAILPGADKVTRMSVQSAKIEAGHVRIPETAPWLGEFQKEMLSFPHGRFDDQVASVSPALLWIFRVL
jgi:predicted phage terminase large subunit-like protein